MHRILDLKNSPFESMANLLSSIDLRKIPTPGSFPFTLAGLALGSGNQALEVLVATHTSLPAKPTLRAAWKERNAGRAAPFS